VTVTAFKDKRKVGVIRSDVPPVTRQFIARISPLLEVRVAPCGSVQTTRKVDPRIRVRIGA
jgi:hypothetical protein